MSDKTFREQVEGTISDLLQELGFDNELPKTKKRYTARILVAHDREMERIAKGFCPLRNPYVGIKDQSPEVFRVFNRATSIQLKADQAYLLAERAGK